MKKPELLAPAGSMNMLRAAVDAGADAVMIHSRKTDPSEILPLQTASGQGIRSRRSSWCRQPSTRSQRRN